MGQDKAKSARGPSPNKNLPEGHLALERPLAVIQPGQFTARGDSTVRVTGS